MNLAQRIRGKLPDAAYLTMLAYLYAIAASQAVWSFAYKWTTIVEHPEYSLDKILGGTWPKPYAFRVLIRSVVDALTHRIPEFIATPWIERSRQALEVTQGAKYALLMDDRLVLGYAIAMTSAFVFLFASLLLLRAIGKLIYSGTRVARVVLDLSPIAFALLLTISYRAHNGYIYDHFELFAFLLYMFLVLRGRNALTLVILAFAILNKETAIFFPLFGAAMRMGRDRTWLRSNLRWVAAEFAVVLIGFAAIRFILREHPGVTTEWHFFVNLGFWFSKAPWIAVTAPHFGLLPLPKPSNIAVLWVFLVIVFGYWKSKPAIVVWPLITAIVINIPLFILFCWKDEYRNLSLTFPFIYLASVHSLLMYFNNEPVENA